MSSQFEVSQKDAVMAADGYSEDSLGKLDSRDPSLEDAPHADVLDPETQVNITTFLQCMCTLLKMSCYSSTTMCQYWDNCLIY